MSTTNCHAAAHVTVAAATEPPSDYPVHLPFLLIRDLDACVCVRSCQDGIRSERSFRFETLAFKSRRHK